MMLGRRPGPAIAGDAHGHSSYRRLRLNHAGRIGLMGRPVATGGLMRYKFSPF